MDIINKMNSFRRTENMSGGSNIFAVSKNIDTIMSFRGLIIDSITDEYILNNIKIIQSKGVVVSDGWKKNIKPVERHYERTNERNQERHYERPYERNQERTQEKHSWRNSGINNNINNHTNNSQSYSNKIGNNSTNYRTSSYIPTNAQSHTPSSDRPSSDKPSNIQSHITPNITSKKYVSHFKSDDKKVDSTILHTIINGKLNKFSPSTYNEIKEFLEQILDSGEVSFVKEFMLLVFKKAATEEVFCPHYARLLAELSVSYSSLKNEILQLQIDFLEIFKEVEETECKDYAAFIERNKQKQYRIGYSQFLAELTSKEILEGHTIITTFITLLDQIKLHAKQDGKGKLIDEYSDCIVRMSKVFKNTSVPYITNLKELLKDAILDIIKDIITNSSELYPSISRKTKFSLMDVNDILTA